MIKNKTNDAGLKIGLIMCKFLLVVAVLLSLPAGVMKMDAMMRPRFSPPSSPTASRRHSPVRTSSSTGAWKTNRPQVLVFSASSRPLSPSPGGQSVVSSSNSFRQSSSMRNWIGNLSGTIRNLSRNLRGRSPSPLPGPSRDSLRSSSQKQQPVDRYPHNPEGAGAVTANNNQGIAGDTAGLPFPIPNAPVSSSKIFNTPGKFKESLEHTINNLNDKLRNNQGISGNTVSLPPPIPDTPSRSSGQDSSILKPSGKVIEAGKHLASILNDKSISNKVFSNGNPRIKKEFPELHLEIGSQINEEIAKDKARRPQEFLPMLKLNN